MPSFESRACKGAWEPPESTPFRCLYLPLTTFPRHHHIKGKIKDAVSRKLLVRSDTQRVGFIASAELAEPIYVPLKTATATTARGG